MSADARPDDRPIVVITGAAGAIGSSLASVLEPDYRVVGLDLEGKNASVDCIATDLTSDHSVDLALRKFHERYGKRIASVVHLAAYFDFTGEDSPLYQKVNIEGTRRLLAKLQEFEVGQFVYSGTMLVHEAGKPGERVSEETPIAPSWVYPKSKAATEDVIRETHGEIPYVLLHLAGLYDDHTAVPTLSHQIARIYERSIKSRLYSGDLQAGQSFVHKEDMLDAFRRTVDRRESLPEDVTILIGEPDAASYETLQDTIGRLIHGDDEWTTLKAPKAFAKAGAWAEEAAEPVVPDSIDQGEKPFIRPFMIDMADDHYALDISRAGELLDWRPKHRILDTLPAMIEALKQDPAGWYRQNGITPPPWLEIADEKVDDPEELRAAHEKRYRSEHQNNLWAPFFNLGLGLWLITSPPTLGYESFWLTVSDVVSGIAILIFAFLSLSWRLPVARWATAAVGLWVMTAPLVFWAPTAAAYLNDTLIGVLIMGFAILVRPTPGIDRVAAETGPTIPPGWSFCPSSWFQRMPIIVLALVGLFTSRYLCAYQLGHIDGVWEPFFAGGPDPGNGTEEIITSSVSEAWPVPDAGVGALTYMLEILTGVIGSSRRWRTMPWLVMLFSIMIVPLGAVSITFIVIQPILLGTWCTLCVIAAAAMLLQIPYSLDELVATGQFLHRRWRAGDGLFRVFFVGGTDDGPARHEADDFERAPGGIVKEMVVGGVSVPWNLALCLLIGIWLMFTRLTLGTEGGMADADHLIGALVLTVTVTAFAEIARPMRFFNMAFGLALMITPFAYSVPWLATIASLAAGLALILLSIRRGPIRSDYGGWSAIIV
jgi:nucleoside-diphosphate-sugar epimerase